MKNIAEKLEIKKGTVILVDLTQEATLNYIKKSDLIQIIILMRFRLYNSSKFSVFNKNLNSSNLKAIHSDNIKAIEVL